MLGDSETLSRPVFPGPHPLLTPPHPPAHTLTHTTAITPPYALLQRRFVFAPGSYLSGRSYVFTVKATNSQGSGQASAPLQVNTPRCAPQCTHIAPTSPGWAHWPISAQYLDATPVLGALLVDACRLCAAWLLLGLPAR